MRAHGIFVGSVGRYTEGTSDVLFNLSQENIWHLTGGPGARFIGGSPPIVRNSCFSHHRLDSLNAGNAFKNTKA